MAEIITVEQDGSGDFNSLESAANSLSVGDTLSIGSGLWDASFPWDSGSSGTVDVLLPISVDGVTILGDLAGGTVLGRRLDDGGSPFDGPAIVTAENVESIRIERVSIGGVTRGYVGLGDEEANFDLVEFDRCTIPAIITGRATFSDCVFSRTANVGVFTPNPGATVDIRSCEFVGGSIGLQMNPGSDGQVSNCTFEGVDSAIISDGSTISVEHSEFRNVNLPLTARRDGGRLDVRGVVVETSDFGGLYCRTRAIATVVDSRFADVRGPVIDINSGAQVHMTGSQILPRDNGLFINASTLTTSPRIDLNFENNYWGTTDAEEIRARIVDGEDWPGNPAFNIFVDFEPILLVPVEGAAESVGSLKARFLSRDD